jgi:hypothetical protein
LGTRRFVVQDQVIRYTMGIDLILHLLLTGGVGLPHASDADG